MAEMYSLPKNVHLGWSIWATFTQLFVDQSSPIFWPNVEGVVFGDGIFRLSTWWSVPKIFAMKVESCQTLRRILDVFFALTNFRGRAFRKLYTRYHLWPAARRPEKFHEDTPTRSGVIVAHTLNFRPNFKFLRLNFFWGTPVPVGVCARLLWSISSVCKNLRTQHLLRAEM